MKNFARNLATIGSFITLCLVTGLIMAVYLAPHSHAAEAHHAGTTVTAHGKTLELDAHRVVKSSSLPVCAYEDGGKRQPCTWNISAPSPIPGGLAYWIDREDRTHYVWAHTPARNGWHFLSRRDALRLASYSYRPVTYWQSCVVKYTRTTQTLRCANGYRYSDAR